MQDRIKKEDTDMAKIRDAIISYYKSRIVKKDIELVYTGSVNSIRRKRV